jgi:hypothetical protein
MSISPTQAAQIPPTANAGGLGAQLRRASSGVDHGAPVKLTRDQLMMDAKMGIYISAPMEAVFNSQAYRRGEINASKYTATILANSLGFGAWTIGGALAVAALTPFVPAFLLPVAGFAAGMIANDIWDRTFGAAIVKYVGDALPEKLTKPFADVFTKFVANPIVDWVWNPIKNAVMGHKVLAATLVGGLMLLPPMRPFAKGLLKEAGVWVGGGAIAMAAQFGIINRFLPAAAHREHGAKAEKPETTAAGSEEAEALKYLQEAYTTAFGKFKERGADAAAASQAAQRWLVETLCENGAKRPEAEELVKLAVASLTPAANAPVANRPAANKPATNNAPVAQRPAPPANNLPVT